jgi:transketolase
MIHAAGSGHPGGSLSAVEILTALYFDVMRIDPRNPDDPDRDRFLLSKGHAAPVLYSVLARRGFFDPALLPTLRQLGSPLQGHPHMESLPGLDCSSGSLGQGLSIANGLAMAAKKTGRNYRTYCLLGDGEVQEGQIWEAAMFAAAKKLDNLIAFTDYNKLQIDNTVEKVNDIAPLAEKWAAFGWNVIEVEDGNDVDQVSAAVEHAKLGIGSGKPTMVILNTLKGCGVPWIVDLGPGNHNCNISEEQADAAIAELRKEA